jgi:cold shock CspA family protein
MAAMTERRLQVGDVLEGEVCGWFTKGRGYGFARVEGVSRDIFLPSANLLDATALDRGERVRFELRMDRDGRWFGDHIESLPAWSGHP